MSEENGSVIELAPNRVTYSRAEERSMPSVVDSAPPSPMGMLAVAIQKGMDPATIKDLMDLHDRWEKGEARKEFTAALSKFKADPPVIYKDKQVKFQTGRGVMAYKHATLDQVSSEIGKALAVHGLSHRWNVEQKAGAITVTCILQHSAGHTESVQMEALADQSGSKNAIQAVGSTVTYLERYTLLAATGMAVRDQDNDGRGATEDGDAPEPERTQSVAQPRAKSAPPAAPAPQEEPAPESGEAVAETDSPLLSDGAKATLRKAMDRAGVEESALVAGGFGAVDAMKFSRFNAAMAFVKANHAPRE